MIDSEADRHLPRSQRARTLPSLVRPSTFCILGLLGSSLIGACSGDDGDKATRSSVGLQPGAGMTNSGTGTSGTNPSTSGTSSAGTGTSAGSSTTGGTATGTGATGTT